MHKVNQISKAFTILIAEDDEDDYLLTLEALKEGGVNNEVHWVKDGDEVMEYLKSLANGAKGNNGASGHLPGLILLDLNMPKKDGREALAEIKSNPKFRKIPVIVMTTSSAENDIAKSYDLGVNSFIQKPVRFNDLVGVTKAFANYWIKTVKLPT